MMGKMWELMRLNPFAAAMPGGAQGVGPSFSMMSNMMAPLTNIEELDKRVTDMRAVEHWLKLNLNMLQSAIQALEVQRATLATLRAFGAFAQTSVEGAKNAAAKPDATPPRPEPHESAEPAGASKPDDDTAAPPPGFDPGNVLQSQFNQLAQFAMIQPGMTGVAGATQPAGASGASAGADAAATGPDDADEKAPESAAAKKAPSRRSAPRKKPE